MYILTYYTIVTRRETCSAGRPVASDLLRRVSEKFRHRADQGRAPFFTTRYVSFLDAHLFVKRRLWQPAATVAFTRLQQR